jgi:hypothetical protein
MEYDPDSTLRTRQGFLRLNWNKNFIGDHVEDISAWTANGTPVVTANVADSPNGDTTVDRVEDDDAASAEAVYQALIPTSLTATQWTGSVYVKMPTGLGVGLRLVFLSGGTTNEYDVVLGQHGVGDSIVVIEPPNSDGADSFGLGESVTYIDSVSALSYTMQQFYVTGTNTDAANVAVRLNVYPAWCGTTSASSVTSFEPADAAATLSQVGTAELWGASLEPGTFSPRRPNVSGTAIDETNTPQTLITSVHTHVEQDGDKAIYATSAESGEDQIWRFNATTEAMDNITSTLVLPQNAQWQWVNFNDLAVACNGATAGDSMVKVATVSSNAAALGGTPPNAKRIAVWNKRVWVVDADEPWLLKCSAINDAEDWTETDPRLGTGEFPIGNLGEPIHAIFPWNDLLLVFRENDIWAMRSGTPETDIGAYYPEQLVDGIGGVDCPQIAAAILGDVVFISPEGLMSLQSLLQRGRFDNAILSKHVEDFQNLNVFSGEMALGTYHRKAQLLVSISTGTNTVPDKTYLVDFTNVEQKKLPFTRINHATSTSNRLGRGFAPAEFGGRQELLVAGETEASNSDPKTAFVHFWDLNTTFGDDGYKFDQEVQTKHYDGGTLTDKKRLLRWEAVLSNLSGTNPTRRATITANQSTLYSVTSDHTLDNLGSTFNLTEIGRRFADANLSRFAHSVAIKFDNSQEGASTSTGFAVHAVAFILKLANIAGKRY